MPNSAGLAIPDGYPEAAIKPSVAEGILYTTQSSLASIRSREMVIQAANAWATISMDCGSDSERTNLEGNSLSSP